MALIIQRIPLLFDFRRAVCANGMPPFSALPSDFLLLEGSANTNGIPRDAFALYSVKRPLTEESLCSALQQLEESGVAGVCLCFPGGDGGDWYAGRFESLSYPVYILTGVSHPQLLLEEGRSLLEGSYETWCAFRFHQQLLRAVQNTGDALGACLRLLEETLGYEIRLFFHQRQITFPPLSAVFTDAEITAALSTLLEAGAVPTRPVSLRVSGRSVWAVPFPGSAYVPGYMTAVSDLEEIPEIDRTFICKCLPYAASDLLELKMSRRYQRLDRQLFFHDLLFSRINQSAEAVLKNAERIGCPAERRRMVLALLLPQAAGHTQSLESDIQAVCPFHVDYAVAPEPCILIVVISGTLSDVPSDNEAAFRAFLSGFHQRFALREGWAVMGVGNVCGSLSGIRESYNEAITLLRIGATVSSETDIYYFDHYLIHYVVDFFRESPIFLGLYSSTIDRLRSSGGSWGPKMVHTLSVLSSCHFSVQKAAKRLFLHRNSLYDRLDVMQKQFKMDMKSPEAQLMIQLLLILDDLLHNTAPSFQAPMFSFDRQCDSTVILWEYEFPQSAGLSPEILEFESHLKELFTAAPTLESLLNLSAAYTRHPIDLVSTEDFSGFTKHNSLLLLNVSQVLKRNEAFLHNTKKPVCFRVGQLTFIAYKVMQGNHLIGYLTVNYREGNHVAETDVQLLECLAPYIAAWMMSNRYSSTISRSKADFYRKLIIDHFENDEEFLRKECFRFGISLQSQRFIMIISCDPACSCGYVQVSEEIEAFFQGSFSTVLCGDVAGSITLLLEAENSESPADMPQLLSELYEYLRQNFGGCVRISASRPCTHLGKLPNTYKEASFAMTLGSTLHPDQLVYNYENYILYHLICTMWEQPALQHLYQAFIIPLLNYDCKYRANMLSGLDAYVRANFCINDAARQSGMHRNGLYKKISKIQEILNLDLDLVPNRLMIQIAMKIYHLKKVYAQTEQTLIWAMSASREQSGSMGRSSVKPSESPAATDDKE